MPDPLFFDETNEDALRDIHWNATMPSPLVYGSEVFGTKDRMRCNLILFSKRGNIKSDAWFLQNWCKRQACTEKYPLKCNNAFSSDLWKQQMQCDVIWSFFQTRRYAVWCLIPSRLMEATRMHCEVSTGMRKCLLLRSMEGTVFGTKDTMRCDLILFSNKEI